MKKSPQEHIESLAKKKSNPEEENTSTIARMLNQQMSQLFHDPRNFIFELLQNADDAKADKVTFKLLGQDLILSHNGDPFTPTDVKRICDAARDSDQNKNTKSQQSEKIGYKGIGFKSVFGISKDIEILSSKTDYYFAFSRGFWQQNETKKIKFPWQILPIWIESPQHRYEKYTVPKKNVIFVLKNVDIDRVKTELTAILEHPEIIVFFRKLDNIEFDFDEGYSISREPREANLLAVKVTNKPEVLWYKSNFTEEVTSTLRKKLNELPDSACPPKIKDKDNTSTIVTFAAQVEVKGENDEGKTYQFKSTLKGDLFCYLPTSVECGLPYLVNANFILSQDRAAIIDNPWNGFLLETIGYKQFEWFGEISNNPVYSRSVLSLLSQEDATTVFPSLERRYRQKEKDMVDNALLASYKKGYESGLAAVPFVLAKDGSLLKLRQSVIDTTLFFNKFDENRFDPSLIDKGQSKLVAYEIDNRDILITYRMVQHFNLEQLLEQVPQYMQRLQGPEEIALRSNVIGYLFKPKFDGAFKSKPIILNLRGELCAPENSFYLKKPNSENPYPEFSDINILNLTLYDAQARGLLRKEIAPLTARNILKKHVSELIFNHKITPESSISILRFIYKAIEMNELSTTDFGQKSLGEFDLTRIPVVTRSKKTMRELRTCIYVESETLYPVPQEQQLSSDYILKDNNRNIWQSIFLCAGVKTSVELTMGSINYVALKEYFQQRFGKGDLIDAYFDYIIGSVLDSKTIGIPRTQKTPANNQKLVFENFIFFDFIFYKDKLDDSMLQLFLMAARQQYQLLCQPAKMRRGLKRGDYTIEIKEHFLAFYFREYCKLPVKGKKGLKRPAELLYGHHFDNLFEQDDIPINIVQLPHSIELIPELIDILGFRKHITVEEGLDLLEAVYKNYRHKTIDGHGIQRIQAIYRLLVPIQLKTSDEEAIRKWKKKRHRLLCSNAKFISLKKPIEVFDKDQLPTDTDEGFWLHNVGLDVASLRKLAGFFQLSCISETLDFTSNPSLDITLQNELVEFDELTAKILPIFVLMESENLKRSPNEFHKQVYGRLSRLNFIACDTIKFTSGKIQHYWVGRKRDDIYIAGSLKANQGRNLQELADLLKNILFGASQVSAEFQRCLINYKDDTVFDEQFKWINAEPQRGTSYTAMISFQRDYPNNLPKTVEDEIDPSETTEEVSPPLFIPKPTFSKSSKTPSHGNNKNTLLGQIRPKNEPESPSKVEFNPVSPGKHRNLPKPGNTELSPDHEHKRKSKKASKADDTTAEEEAEKERQNKVLGDEGERRAFREIERRLIEALGIEPAELTEDMQRQGEDGGPGSRFIKDNHTIDLIWYNKDRGNKPVSESPVDIIIRLDGVSRYYIEVKSTSSCYNPIFFLTSNEWRYMKEKRARSILVRVYDVAEDKQSRINVYKDPYGMIFKGLIDFMSGGKFCLNITKGADMSDHSLQNYEDIQIGCKVM